MLWTAVPPRSGGLDEEWVSETRKVMNDYRLAVATSNLNLLNIFRQNAVFVRFVVVFRNFGRSAGIHFLFFKCVSAVPAGCVHIRFLIGGTLQLLFQCAIRDCRRCTAAVTLVGLVGLGYVFVL
jgi:hypothetical protein